MIDENLSYEDKLNSIIDKLTNTMLTIDTLPKEQAEIAILDTTNKIKEGESYINKMETEINTTNENELISRSPEEINEMKGKIKKYKLRFSIIVQKFNLIREKYIIKNSELFDDVLSPSKDILIEDEIRNNMKNDNDMKKENKNENNTPQHNEGNTENLQNTQNNNVNENNLDNINDRLNQNNIVGDDTFNNLRITFMNKKWKFILILVGVVILIVIIVVLFISIKDI